MSLFTFLLLFVKKISQAVSFFPIATKVCIWFLVTVDPMKQYLKVRSFLDHSCVILISFKIVVIFNMTSADFVLISVDVVQKMTTILKEMRIAQLLSKSERSLAIIIYHAQRFF